MRIRSYRQRVTHADINPHPSSCCNRIFGTPKSIAYKHGERVNSYARMNAFWIDCRWLPNFLAFVKTVLLNVSRLSLVDIQCRIIIVWLWKFLATEQHPLAMWSATRRDLWRQHCRMRSAPGSIMTVKCSSSAVSTAHALKRLALVFKFCFRFVSFFFFDS